MLETFLLIFLAYLNPGSELSYKIVAEGYLTTGFETTIIQGDKHLFKIQNQFGDELIFPETNFIDEALLLIKLNDDQVPEDVEIKNIEKINNEIVVYYSAKNNDSVSKIGNPFVLVKLKPVNNRDKEIKLVDFEDIRPVLANLSLGQTTKYDNSLARQTDTKFIDYIPLDRGNSWEYEVTSQSKTVKTKSQIISIYEGWSIINDFFGKRNLGLKIDYDGEFLVASESGIRPFYNSDVIEVISSKENFEVKAGSFNDLLIVSIPRNDGIWFKDVYARDIGLIYHEHGSPKGLVTYSLINAVIKGKSLN